jgi:hypothetical protein
MVRYEPIDILKQANSCATLKARYPTPNLLILVEPSIVTALPRNCPDKENWYTQFTIYELDMSDAEFEKKAESLIADTPNEWLILCCPIFDKAVKLCSNYGLDITQAHYSYFGV